MLYQLFYSYVADVSFFNVFRYITFRSFLAFITAFTVCLIWGPYFIASMVRKQKKQVVRDDGPQSHLKKSGTPTMGGALVMGSAFIAASLWANWHIELVWACLFITMSFAAVGYADDALKVIHKNPKGLSGKVRLALEFSLAFVAIGCLVYFYDFSTVVGVPFFKNLSFDLGWGYVFFAGFVIVGCANAFNLTDGLDGLAIVPFMIAAATLMIFAYVAGHSHIAEYLQIPFVKGAGELAPLCAAMFAAGLGFLWYNSYPAQVFMGDVGSLGLGGFLGVMAILTKNELILVVLGGIFVVEALSVIAQVASFKLRGKRIFKMAPIHHHFELKGVAEPKVIVRFWIVAIILAIISLSTLKLR